MNRWVLLGLSTLFAGVACTQAAQTISNEDESIARNESAFSAASFSPEFALEHPVAAVTNASPTPHLAAASSCTLLVWESNDVYHADVWAMRLDATGKPLAPRATLITRAV